MQREGYGAGGSGKLLAVALVLAMVFLAFVTRGVARAVMDATTECLSQFQGVPAGDENGGSLTCTDCDPSCDSDGVATPNKMCTFQLQVCLNHAQGTCTAANIKKVKVKGMGCKVTGLRPTPAGTSSLCGAFTGITVKTKKKGKKPGKCTIVVMASSKGKPKKVDKDKLLLTCNPQFAASCPSPTTTTS